MTVRLINTILFVTMQVGDSPEILPPDPESQIITLPLPDEETARRVRELQQAGTLSVSFAWEDGAWEAWKRRQPPTSTSHRNRAQVCAPLDGYLK